MTNEEAKQDLKGKVVKMMCEAVVHSLACIDKLEDFGAGLVQDHQDNMCNYITPRHFITAFAEEMKMQYAVSQPTRKDVELIRKYELMM